MKTLAALVLVGACCRCAAGQCVEIPATELPEVKPSSRNAKITVSLGGEPQGNVKLTVSLPAGRASRSFVSDSDGSVMLKDLPEGTICVTAAAETNLTDVLCLEVPAHSKDEVSSFYMALSLTAPPLNSNSFDNRVKRAERSAPSLRLRKLAGTVVDKTGVVILKAEVQVYRRGKYPHEALTTLRTNEAGRFEFALEPGVYTVVIRMLGFRSEFFEMEISRDGSESELHKTLQVVATDQCGDDYRGLRSR